MVQVVDLSSIPIVICIFCLMPHELTYYIIHALYVSLTLYLEKYKFYMRVSMVTQNISQFRHSLNILSFSQVTVGFEIR